jgi:excinuclease ABC subunit C
MEEMLTRRFNRWQAAQDIAQAPGKKPDPAFALLPDLLIVDGGKGQLSRAAAVLERNNLFGQVPVFGLAKQNEELFVPGRAHPILLPRQSQGFYLLTASPSLPTATGAINRASPPNWMPSPASGQPAVRRS